MSNESLIEISKSIDYAASAISEVAIAMGSASIPSNNNIADSLSSISEMIDLHFGGIRHEMCRIADSFEKIADHFTP